MKKVALLLVLIEIIAFPLLLIWVAADRMAGRGQALSLAAQFADADPVILADAGHGPAAASRTGEVVRAVRGGADQRVHPPEAAAPPERAGPSP